MGFLLVVGRSLAAMPPSADDERRPIGRLPRELAESRPLGPAPADLPLERIVLVLRPRDPDGLARFLSQQQDPGSPLYHRWLTPEEFGARFGPAREDVARLTDWLGSQGLSVDVVAAGRLALVFSGRVADVERAFATRIDEVEYRGALHRANAVVPTLPARVAGVAAGVLSLHDFQKRRPLSRPASEVAPLFNSGGGHRLAPADFARIYGMEPLYASGTDGSGVTIAIAGRTNVNLGDTRFFRQFFGLAAKDPEIVLNGEDPGMIGSGETLEANLDIQWSGGLAPKANVKLIVSKSTDATDGIDLSCLYAVDRNIAEILSVSFGQCERDFEPSNLVFYANIWAQAAAQGISVFVASGDTGVAGCDAPNGSRGTVTGVNGLSSPPYATCVGGSQFDDGASNATFWDGSNDSVTKRSALGYIPEVAWNESGIAGGSGLYGTGGGFSTSFARPTWQSAPGLEAGAMRALPDISVAAAGHTAYAMVQGHSDVLSGLTAVLGTSASAPAFAGVAALLVQRRGRLGNLNPSLYALGAAQYGGGGPHVFHDITAGNNSVPGLEGFYAGVGFDAATGLGSVDVAALLAALPAPTLLGDVTAGAHPAVVQIKAGESAKVTVTLDAPAGGIAIGSVTATLPEGFSVEFSPGLDSAKSREGFVSTGIPSELTLTASDGVAAGSYPVDLLVTSGNLTRRLRLTVAVGSASASFGTAVEEQVPVVLDVFGAAKSHYTSDLVAVNRSKQDATLLLRYVPQPGTSGAGGPVIARSLPQGRELYVSDVIAFLRANGYALAADDSAKLGTLFVTFVGVRDRALVFAGSRTTTPNLNASVGGAFGTFASSVPSGGASAPEAWVYGLRENGAYRSNLAVVHGPGGSSSGASAGPITVEIQVFDGETGQPTGAPTPVTLQIGELHQLNSVLTMARAGLSNGYARVRRTAGADRFIAYGVVNDGGSAGGGTSDGSFIVSGGSDGLVPIVLDLPGATHYQTELTLTNTSSSASTVTLAYTPSLLFPGASDRGTVTTTLAAGRQLVASDTIAFLRTLGLPIPADGTKQGGTLAVAGAVALARTFNPNPDAAIGGTYGLSYPAVGSAARAKAGAIVYGLRQDEQVRTNLAIADARDEGDAPVTYEIEIFDSATGSTQPVQTLHRTLLAGQWTQIDTVLVGAGITRGYARIRPTDGLSDFVAYGVINDGGKIGSRTSDGSYLTMVVEVP